MPRKIIITKEEIWQQRQSNYAKYLAMHNLAMQQTDQTRAQIIELLFEPELNILGKVEGYNYRVQMHKLKQDLNMPRFDTPEFNGQEMLVKWLWSKQGFEAYVNEFNNLEDPLCDYEMKYSLKEDRIFYEPLAYGVQVPYKSRTTHVQVP